MKRLVIAVLTLLLAAGCSQLCDTNPFVGTWIGHGELTEADTPSAGHTTVTTLDDVITFGADMTFSLSQGFRQTVDESLTMDAFQKGTGTYLYDAATLTMTFSATSDPGLNDDTPTYSFSKDGKTCTIQPTTLTFPLVFAKAQ
jgi:hypothetical protein